MNPCYGPRFSCGACCGLSNLDLNREARDELLRQRRRALDARLPQGREGWRRYRQARESEEAEITRRNPELYVCPFFGPLLRSAGRYGCMIHPQETDDPRAQDVGFYGSSICLGYDCRNKERDSDGAYAAFAQSVAVDGHEYSRLMGDVRWFELWRRLGGGGRLPNAEFMTAFVALSRRRLQHTAGQAITSFESPWEGIDEEERWLRLLIGEAALEDGGPAGQADDEIRKCLEAAGLSIS